MQFNKETKLYSYEIQRKGGEDIIYINYIGAPYVPSISEHPEVMERTIDVLMENPNVSRVVFVQQKNYNYDFKEIALLLEIAQLYVYLVRQEKVLSQEKLITNREELFTKRYNDVFSFLLLLKQDPIAAYNELKKIIIQAKISLDKTIKESKTDVTNYIHFLEKIFELLENTKLIQSASPYFKDYQRGDREIYYKIFNPDVIPNFTFTRLVSDLPRGAEIVDQYKIVNNNYDESLVTILRRKDEAKLIYHLNPPENSLSEEHSMLLNLARGVLIEHQPKAEEFTDTERVRQVFFNISKDLLQDLAQSKEMKLNYSDLNKLAVILVRHTVGFGLIEVLLQDKKLQDIVLNSPISMTNIFLRHQDYDECSTNILPSQEDVDSWAAKFRMISGRPLDEANPILDTQLEIGNIRARIAIIQQPLSPDGLAYAIRRHREQPWTLPLFVKNKMLNPFAAGLFSFLIDGSRTLLVAGTRSSGKCVDGNTLIQLSDGNLKKIKDLIGKEKKKIDDGIIYEPKSEFYVKSLDGLKIKDKKITDVWKRNSPDKIIKIKTKSGKEIITTKEHPYFIYNEGLKNKRADELKEKDLIASPRRLNISSENILIDLKDNPCLIDEFEDFFILKGKTNSLTVKFPKKLTSELAEFIGMILGDGHLNLSKLEFHNSCRELRERYISLLKMFNIKYRIFSSRTTTVVQVTSRVLSRVLRDIFKIPFGKKSDKIIIPEIILKSDKNVLASFLRGYFDCDGHIPKGKRDLELVTASKFMSEHLRLALLRFGITCFTKPKKVNGVFYYRILIRGKFVSNFAREIGFFHPMKKERLDFLMKNIFLENTNVDVIPQGNEILRKLRKKLRISPKDLREFGKDYWAYENNQYRVTRNWFKKHIKFYKDKFEHFYSWREEIENLERIADFDCEGYLFKLEKLRNLLILSYMSLAVDSRLSEAGFRKILQKQKLGNIEVLEEVSSLVNVFNKRVDELSSLRDVDVNVKSVPLFVNSGVVSYAGMSRELSIPESSLKSYCYGGINAPENLEILIGSKLQEIKNKLVLKLKEAANILNELQGFGSLFKSIQSGVLISNLRNGLNISNEEFVSENVSITTVSNFFNGRYTPSFEVLESIVNTLVNKFNSVISGETKELIFEADKLANSDIFWDEVISVEEIGKVDDFVYDLTIEDTHNFVANGIVAHNTSLLGSLMLEIIPKNRIIVIEDSLELPVESLRKLEYDILRMKVRSALLKTTTEVSADDGIRTSLRLGDSCLIMGEVRSSLRGDQEVIIIDKGITKRIPIKNLESVDVKNISLPTLTKDNKVELKPLSGFVKHPKRQELLKFTTNTGREVIVTPDHSVFTHVDFKIAAINSDQLKVGDPLIIPSKIPCGFNNINYFNLLEIFQNDYRLENAEPYIRKAIKILGWKKASKICRVSDVYRYLLSTQKTRIPIKSFLKLMKESKIKYALEDLRIKRGTSKSIPAKFPVNENTLRLIGYYLAEGNISKDKIQVTNSKPEIIEDIKSICKNELGLGVTQRDIKGYGSSVQMYIMSKPLLDLFVYLGCGKTSFYKRIPEFIYGLSKRKICAMLQGMYSGDGSFTSSKKAGNLVRYFSTSRKLIEDVSYALLCLGIVCRLHESKPRKRGRKICYIAEIKKRNYIEFFLNNIGFTHKSPKMLIKSFSHSKDDSVFFEPIELEKHVKLPRKYRHLRRTKCCSKDYLRKLTEEVKCSDELYDFAHGDFFVDKVKSIEIINLSEPEYVYDLAVKSTQRFVGGFGGILLHNTEAKALYEAMRVGALANVVAGTIHGASPYGVFDRVVNDLGVPATSFKATDIIGVCNPIKTPDGLHSFRRVVQISEVRKHWQKDPLLEKGFVDLMKYNVEKDELEVSEDLINGDSEIIKGIAANVRGWAGNWDAIYDNILLRAKIKKEIVDVAKITGDENILEAKFNTRSNHEFHKISDEISQEIGLPMSERVFPAWQKWLNGEIKGKKI